MMQLAAVIVGGLSILSVVSAVARRIAGPYSQRQGAQAVLGAYVGAGGQRAVQEMREELDQLRGEVGSLRERMAELDEVQNRLDFAERMLAQVRERPALPGSL